MTQLHAGKTGCKADCLCGDKGGQPRVRMLCPCLRVGGLRQRQHIRHGVVQRLAGAVRAAAGGLRKALAQRSQRVDPGGGNALLQQAAIEGRLHAARADRALHRVHEDGFDTTPHAGHAADAQACPTQHMHRTSAMCSVQAYRHLSHCWAALQVASGSIASSLPAEHCLSW